MSLPPPESAPLSAAMSTIIRPSPALLIQPSPPQLLPTVTQASQFLGSFFPLRPRDVQWLYHSPRNPRYSPDTAPVSRMILSITPTQGVYKAIYNTTQSSTPPFVFLHRPFTLDRARVPRGVNVVSSHVGFDEVLTVGWNQVLARRLGMREVDAVCIQGYKGDPERRIGIESLLKIPTTLGAVAGSIKHEFGRWDAIYGADVENSSEMAQEVTVVAIMNAFHPEEVDRVMEAAFSRGWIPNLENGDSIVYLTGQAREPGLVAAQQKNMKVFCVGHRSCEEWGVRYLASELKREFPMVDVQEVYEDEEPREPRKSVVPKRPAASAGLPERADSS